MEMGLPIPSNFKNSLASKIDEFVEKGYVIWPYEMIPLQAILNIDRYHFYYSVEIRSLPWKALDIISNSMVFFLPFNMPTANNDVYENCSKAVLIRHLVVFRHGVQGLACKERIDKVQFGHFCFLGREADSI